MAGDQSLEVLQLAARCEALEQLLRRVVLAEAESIEALSAAMNAAEDFLAGGALVPVHELLAAERTIFGRKMAYSDGELWDRFADGVIAIEDRDVRGEDDYTADWFRERGAEALVIARRIDAAAVLDAARERQPKGGTRG